MRLPEWSDSDRRDAALLRAGAAVDNQEWLTRQQLAVVFLLSHGFTLHEIAATLGVGWYTVRDHAKQARVRLDTRSNAHAVATALRLGLIS